MNKSHFICQRWFAVEEDDGAVGTSSVDYTDHAIESLDRTAAARRW